MKPVSRSFFGKRCHAGESRHPERPQETGFHIKSGMTKREANSITREGSIADEENEAGIV
jgi:hypothetical protein